MVHPMSLANPELEIPPVAKAVLDITRELIMVRLLLELMPPP
jgi:hypothetical protein